MAHAFEQSASLASRPPVLDRFRVLGRVGLGGMSEVLLALEEVQGEPLRSVALKLVRTTPQADLAAGPAARLFEREARTLIAVGHHPNLCHGYERLKLGERSLLAMEWIDGLSLRALTRLLGERGERLAPGEAAALIAQAAAGLHHAHTARRADGTPLALVHLDVNPSNLMVRYDGVLKVIDFGVARAACEAPLEVDRLLVGKFGYMAPEQLRGEPLDRRCDVFALGVCLFELLAGRKLYRSDNLPELCAAVCDEALPSLAELAPHVPAALTAITERALHKEPGARFQSAGELQAALETFLVVAHLPMGARPIARVLERVVPDHARAPRLRPSSTLDELGQALGQPVLAPAHAVHAGGDGPTDEYTVTVAMRAMPAQRRSPHANPPPLVRPTRLRHRVAGRFGLLLAAAAAALALATQGPALHDAELGSHARQDAHGAALADAPHEPLAPRTAAPHGAPSATLDTLRTSFSGADAVEAPDLARLRRAAPVSSAVPSAPRLRRPSHGFVQEPGF
jgi:eukaryotic-like serine/threonine-protein kinase